MAAKENKIEGHTIEDHTIEDHTIEDHTIEEGFQKLDEILTSLESKDISLEESFKLYQQGIAEVAFCNDKIEATAKQVKILQDGVAQPFEEELI